jgi:WD40 repeat protein
LRRDGDAVLSQSNHLARPSSLIPLYGTGTTNGSGTGINGNGNGNGNGIGVSWPLNGEEAPLEFGYHGTLLHTYRHDATVTHIIWTDDSRFIISASCDATVKMWQISTANQVITITSLPLLYLCLAISFNDTHYVYRYIK